MEFFNFVMALSPIVVVLVGILAFHQSAKKVAPIALVWTLILAFTYFNVTGATFKENVATYDSLVWKGLKEGLKIVLMVFGAFVILNLLRETGAIEDVKSTIARISVDRRVQVELPDLKGREEILKVHTKNKPLAPDVSLRVIAQRTAGFAGADLENLVNEAALLAARRSRKAITMEDIEEASMKVMAGPEKKSRVVTPEEKKLTAYHEAGHAVAGFYCKHHPRVHEITIIPRGQAGGYTMYLPEKDRSYVTKGEMFEDIVSSLGGRVAEQLILEDISTGASNDLQQATNIARQMITRYGFSERLGPVVYGTSQEETFLGRDFGQGKGYSETTAAEIDSETRDIIDEAYETCRRTLTEHIDQLHALAKALMEREKLNEEQFNTIMAGGTLPPCEDAKPEQAQPDQTVQPAPVQPAEPAETAERAEPAEQAEPAQPEMPQPDAPEQQD